VKTLTYVWLVLLIASGCRPGAVTPPDFNGDRAYGYLKDQVAFGPRVPETNAWSNCRRYTESHFLKAGLTVDSQSFVFKDPYSGRDVRLVNLIASYRVSQNTEPPILLVAHYDSRPRAEEAVDSSRRQEPVAGANDGASGVAVLMELANLLHERPAAANIDLLLVDGEDWGKPSDLDYYLLGSKEFARSNLSGRYRFALVLDMVGDARQEIFRETYSEQYQKPLNDMVWGVAEQLGVSTFHNTTRHSVIDDHLPLNVAGVPAIDIIDFDYPYWHTELDTPDKCSPVALANVGRVIAYIVYNRSVWPKK
jgi:glutaminyl-peptide cyclotransferase